MPGGTAHGFDGIGADVGHVLVAARLDDAQGLPSRVGALTRGAGSWARQTAAALNGTAFLATGTAQNTPRFSWCAAAGRVGLLLEPAFTNLVTISALADAGADDVPDGWTASGTPATDFVCAAGAPDGGSKLTLKAGCGAGEGALITPSATVAALTQYTSSVWARSPTALEAGRLLYGHETDGGVTFAQIALATGIYDWTRQSVTATTTAPAATVQNALLAVNALAHDLDLACPQCVAGPFRGMWVPTTAGEATKAAELATLNATTLAAMRTAGYVEIPVSPQFASTDPVAVWTPHTWAPNWRVDFDNADRKLKVVVNGTARATSSALTFADGDLLRVSVRYGAWGQTLMVSVNGAAPEVVTDSTAWGDPAAAFAPYLGSREAGANAAPAIYLGYLAAA